MKKIFILLICTSFLLGCKKESIIDSNPVDLSSCFSPEFGTSESEEFFYNLQLGELNVNIDSLITTNNIGYSIEEGSRTVFIYRNFLYNSFQIDDDEIEIRILFEIDNDLNSFEINRIQDFENANFVYGECGIALQTITGNISGSKDADGSWCVNGNLTVEKFTQLKEVTIDDVFRF